MKIIYKVSSQAQALITLSNKDTDNCYSLLTLKYLLSVFDLCCIYIVSLLIVVVVGDFTPQTTKLESRV